MTPKIQIPDLCPPDEVIIGADLISIGRARVGDRVYVDVPSQGRFYGRVRAWTEVDGDVRIQLDMERRFVMGKVRWVSACACRKDW